jgi:YD repeat-containing protein
VLAEKLRFLSKLRFFSKPGAFVPLILFGILLLCVGILAITQESPDGIGQSDFVPDDADMAFDLPDDEEDPYSGWIPPGPPRWFRSNAGGMMLEETPSRLAALRNKYALVIDYVHPGEIESRLLSYYQDDYSIEIRILYEEGKEVRKQWLFRDESGITRLNAVFRKQVDNKVPDNQEEPGLEEIAEGTDMEEDPANADAEIEITGESLADIALTDMELNDTETADAELSGETGTEVDAVLAADTPPAADNMPDLDSPLISESAVSAGFIELYNDNAQIIEDRWLFDDDSIIMIRYFYNGSVLMSAETHRSISGSDFSAMYTDDYRYNRSFSLRRIERRYHEASKSEPVRLAFPSRVLEAAADANFISDKLFVASDFMESAFVGEGFRMTYDTDSRGRILIQTMIDNDDKTVWVIKNIWSGDRIVSSLKTEDEDEKLTEYEYDVSGNRIVQRDIHNGVLERQVYTKGGKETEELYLNGALVLRAYWEDGKKISEERVRRQ